jgi:transposase-like protein
MKGTMFEGTKTSLVTWVNIIIDLCDDGETQSISANKISERYELTYKTAWRICKQIREAKGKHLNSQLTGTIEIDESFFGGHRKQEKESDKGEHRGKGIGDKHIVFGMLQRKKRLRLFHIQQKNAETIRPLISIHIKTGATIHHDGNTTYGDLKAAGYNPKLVGNKAGKEFRRGISNNNIETTWAKIKSRILSTHRWVSAKHLQSYLDEYSFYYETKKESESLLSIVQRLILA